MREDLHRAARRFGAASLIGYLLLLLEGARVSSAAGAEIFGDWEAYVVLRLAPAIAHVLLAGLILVVVAYAAMLPLLDSRRGRVAWAVAAAMIALPVALELSVGRKARALGVRVPFVLGVMIGAALVASVLAPVVRARSRGQRWAAPLIGVALLAASLELDRRVLPRLYPVFHHALVAGAAIAVVFLAEGLLALAERRRFVADGLAVVGVLVLAYSAARVPRAGRELAKYDNARRILDERSESLGRAAAWASRHWPPPPLDEAGDAPDPLATSTTRALDATGRDLLVVTIDALRADHVGAYGYTARPTTPNLDALAREGVVFERAYTATPHTSYAISSLMTGKYMRPVLALEAASGGARRPDETWAGLLRTYGFRTAALFPEAVWAVDAQRFTSLIERKLDFEYFKIEFAAPDLRAQQVSEYLAAAPKEKPLFVWVHLFEPHEPYVRHPAHDFGDGELARYDSEIAAADDGLGKMVREFRAKRPGAIVIVSADHGEAFGEHGARYHGTTVYEEQTRVPLVISAPGLVAQRRVQRPVQLVDLMPTILSAYGIPKPPRARGLDLGPLLAQKEPPRGEGIAFSEVEDMAMLARGELRLVCNRKTSTCPLYDLSKDPLQLAPIATSGGDVDRLRKELAAVLAGSARLEGFAGSDAAKWPDALRRGFAGDVEAAVEVAALLDDVDPMFRARAAEVLARLGNPSSELHVRRALGSEKDEAVGRWLAIARLRTAREHVATPKEIANVALLLDAPSHANWAALAIGEALSRGGVSPGPSAQARAFDTLVDWFPVARADAELGRAILAVLPAVLHGSQGALSRRATKPLADALGDVRLRVAAAHTLGMLGDQGAAPILDQLIVNERHVDARVPEVLALARLNGEERAFHHLVRYLGVPEPPPGAGDALLTILRLVPPPSFAITVNPPAPTVKLGLVVPPGKEHRLVVAGAAKGAKLRARVLGLETEGVISEAGAFVELGDRVAKLATTPILLEITVTDGKIAAFAVVPRVPDLPPPKPDRSLEDDAAP